MIVEQAEGLLLSLGAEVEVLEPVEVRNRIHATSQAIADRYRGMPTVFAETEQPCEPEQAAI